jgi:hypothetical protein
MVRLQKFSISFEAEDIEARIFPRLQRLGLNMAILKKSWNDFNHEHINRGVKVNFIRWGQEYFCLNDQIVFEDVMYELFIDQINANPLIILRRQWEGQTEKI